MVETKAKELQFSSSNLLMIPLYFSSLSVFLCGYQIFTAVKYKKYGISLVIKSKR
jgi:hypothetical protein